MAKAKYMEFNPPHPSFARQLQIISTVLDTRPDSAFAKKLDQMAREPKIDVEVLELLKEQIFKLPFSYPKSSFIYQPFPEDNLERQMQFWKDAFYERNAHTIWWSPAHITPNREFLTCYRIKLAACWLYDLRNHISCKDSNILDELFLSATPLKYGFGVVLQNNSELLKGFKNSVRDKVARWIEGSQIPSMRDLFEIINEDVLPNKYIYCCEILFIALLLQKVEKMASPFCKLQDVFGELKKNPDYRISNTTPEAFNQYKTIGEEFVTAQKNLRKQAESGDYDFNKILMDFNAFCDKNGKDSFIVEWTRPILAAIAKVYEGEFEIALEIFKEVLPNLFYTFSLTQTAFITGDNKTATIYQPALSLGAVCQNRPFLKLIKSYCVLFGVYGKKIDVSRSSYEKNYPPVNSDSRTRTTEVEDWEEKAWADYFYIYFPKGLVKRSDYLERFESGINGLLRVCEEELPQKPVKPYSKKIIVQYKQFPQLAYFTMVGNVDAVKELINANVDVNEMTSSRDSALLLAIHKLNLTDMPYEPKFGMELFNILKSVPHDSKTINMQSDKQKLTCLGLAVLSGKPDVVKDILDMGAEVDEIHSLERETPLFTVSKLFDPRILLSKYPSKFWSPEMLDSLRRQIPNFRGLSNDQILKTWESKNNEGARMLMEWKQRCIYDQFVNHSNKEDLYRIAEILLDKGADPNYPLEVKGIRNYTPLILAVEMDEIRLFKMMIDHGGDPNKTALHENAVGASCWELALNANSHKVLRYLEENREKFC